MKQKEIRKERWNNMLSAYLSILQGSYRLVKEYKHKKIIDEYKDRPEDLWIQLWKVRKEIARLDNVKLEMPYYVNCNQKPNNYGKTKRTAS